MSHKKKISQGVLSLNIIVAGCVSHQERSQGVYSQQELSQGVTSHQELSRKKIKRTYLENVLGAAIALGEYLFSH